MAQIEQHVSQKSEKEGEGEGSKQKYRESEISSQIYHILQGQDSVLKKRIKKNLHFVISFVIVLHSFTAPCKKLDIPCFDLKQPVFIKQVNCAFLLLYNIITIIL